MDPTNLYLIGLIQHKENLRRAEIDRLFHSQNRQLSVRERIRTFLSASAAQRKSTMQRRSATRQRTVATSR